MVFQASIVIPAYNEESRITALLTSLDDPSSKGKYEVFVICNGCIDRTREVAEQFEGVTVVKIDDVGKHFALNEGDRLAGTLFPRLYIDADVRIDSASIDHLVQEMKSDGPIAVGPSVRYDTSNCSWLVTEYLRGLEVPFVRRWSDAHLMGRGIYGANREARLRFEEFPPLIADDTYFDAHFDAAERFVVPEAITTIAPPTRFWQLLRGEARVVQGNRDLAAYWTDAPLPSREGAADVVSSAKSLPRRLSSLRDAARDVRLADVIPLSVYLLMKVLPRVYLALLKRGQRKVSWR